MRLGIFGGTFDPIHYGHLLLAECCLEAQTLDQVWFMLAATPPHKQQQDISPSSARLEMVNLAIAGHSALKSSSLELDRGGVSYTVDTLTQILQEDPNCELFLLLGTDSWHDLSNWHKPEEICQLATPVVVHRAGEKAPDFTTAASFCSPERLAQIEQGQVIMPAIDLASSELRARTAAAKSLKFRTPASRVYDSTILSIAP